MRNRIDIDEIFSRAIIREIGERLQASLSEGGELTDSLRRQINRLRELDEEASSTAPDLPGDEIGNNSSAEVTLSGALDKPLADAAPTNARLATRAEDFRGSQLSRRPNSQAMDTKTSAKIGRGT